MVQRYDPDINCHIADDGDYVEYVDYEKLINSREKLVEAIETFPDVHMCTCNCEVCLWFRTKARPIQEALKKEVGESKDD